MGEKLAKWLYERLEHMGTKTGRILFNNAVREDLQTLEPAGNTAKRQKEYVLKKLSVCILIVICGVILSIVLWIKEGMETKIVDNRLSRNSYGDGTKHVTLIANDGEHTYGIPVDIEEKCYTQEELIGMAQKAIPVLEDCILGDNQDFDKVEYDMKLVESIENYPFDVEWRVDEEYMDYEGRLVKDKLETPQQMELTAVLTCESFELEHCMTVRICSKAKQPSQAELIARQVCDAESISRESENMTLPSEIGNRSISWSYQRGYSGLLFLTATPILAVFVFFSRDRDLHRQVEDRKEQMCLDYPEIVSELALLIGAGMTVPNAWNKIAEDYRSKRAQDGRKRYAYEEMLLTVYEMESGVTQAKAYEHFGRRCRISSYNKLSALLSQNMKKGAGNLPQLLKEEASTAFEERKHIARKLGEKAGTKLLIPMMMLLGITMVIIMVPAFKTYF